MIPLHRLTHPDDPVYINPDLIQMIEATPDTVVTLDERVEARRRRERRRR